MRTYQYEQNFGFNPEVVRSLLLNITISSETEARFGVPAARLEQWLQELAYRLEPPKPISQNNGRLSAGEIHFLLDGLEMADAMD